ncbi:S-adenosylmethionine:tRNA ribosyltransferase-isomerase [hydrothermal vent metagenome]|uniref:S-adenosylmethionine:tRNA ribosyltransferase-isomerase n=1 Tax=hydrothermal vent metagenome TaxID=652676 RepID=A0A3B1DWC5_9ZZZZ
MTKTSNYNFVLPKDLIASRPIYPPSKAKLLIYHRATNTITHTTFEHIINFIPQKTSIIFNDTKVIKARIFGQKITGGKIELLLNKPLNDNTYSCYIKGRVSIGTILEFNNNLKCTILKLLEDGSRVVKFIKNNINLNFIELIDILNLIGHMPLPPYIKRKDDDMDKKDYQTLFAKKYGAVAAPTASLHFTPTILSQLKSKYNTSYLTLHVGAGTFMPVVCENILEHKIHSEFYDIPVDTIGIINSSDKILAIGTTVTRTIEYYHRTKKTKGEANIFLNLFNKPQRVDYLLTNFHFPESTLIMLVSSFIGLEKTLEIYKEAIDKQYRFYSYGDGMLII